MPLTPNPGKALKSLGVFSLSLLLWASATTATPRGCSDPFSKDAAKKVDFFSDFKQLEYVKIISFNFEGNN